MEIITPATAPTTDGLTQCDECCHLKEMVIEIRYGIMFFRICKSCLQDAIRMLDESTPNP